MSFLSLAIILASPGEMPLALELMFWVLVPYHLLAAVNLIGLPRIPLYFYIAPVVQIAALVVLILLGLKWKPAAKRRFWFFCLGYPLAVFVTNIWTILVFERY